MRLFPRLFLLCLFIAILFIIIAVRYCLNQEKSSEDIEDDAIISLLQSLPEDSQASEGLNNLHANPPPLTLNIAIILVVSLLTVALLITGICCIIIVAVTMDPTLPEDADPLVPELNSCSSDNEFDDENDEEDLYYDSSGRWKAVRSHFPSEFDIFEDLESGFPKKQPRRKSFSH